MSRRELRAIFLIPTALLLGACSLVRTPPPETAGTESGSGNRTNIPTLPQTSSRETLVAPGQRIAALARQQLGASYRFGGATPAGFDCSGLVTYVHSQLGIQTPRTSIGQWQSARAVSLASLQPGDLVFYRGSGAQVDHVVIYVGDGMFVHAPRAGRYVESGRLDDPWYAQRVVGAGRFWPADQVR